MVLCIYQIFLHTLIEMNKKALTFFKKIQSAILIVFLFVNILNSVSLSNSTFINNSSTWITGDFIINNDLTKTTSTTVTLYNTLSWATLMRFWNTIAERDSATWQAFSADIPWVITWGYGNKTVYASFQNASWWTVNIEDEIVLTAPASLPYSDWLTLWFDANDTATITETGWAITQWADKSGNNYNALQDTVTEQPDIDSWEISFNWTSDYFYLEDINYVNTNPLDWILICSVFRTPSTSTSISWNWSFLDFDRSEWFNFYHRWDGVWFSFNAGGTQDINVTWANTNDNNLHVACGSYDNTLENDTVVSIDWKLEYSQNLEVVWSQIWVWKANRYGFIWEWSEASSEDAGRNNIYYNWGIWELLYYDIWVNDTNRKEIECYLWDKWWVAVEWCSVSWAQPIWTIEYTPENETSGLVVANLENLSADVTVTNNGWSSMYTFSDNGTFTFEYIDWFWEIWSTTATVDWIVDNWMPWTSTWGINEAPIITSFWGLSTVSPLVASWATLVWTITSVDHDYNVLWEYWKTTLSGNTWKNVSHADMCSPVVVASHRWNVSWEIQRAPRINNKSSTSFDIKVDNYDSTIWTLSTDIDYIVFEEWAHNINGLQIQADSVEVPNLICSGDYTGATGTPINFTPAFSNPPSVIHTVSTYNDATWVVSWVNDTIDKWVEPTASLMWLTMQRSLNSCVHNPEDIDYIAFEQWNEVFTDWFTLDSVNSWVSVWAVNTSGYPIIFNTPFVAEPEVVLVSQQWENWWNGAYAQIHTGSWVLNNMVYATVDEDWPWADRTHAAEVVSAVSFSEGSWFFTEDNVLSYSIIWGTEQAHFTIDSAAWTLEFITWQDPASPTDANGDGYYEVVVQSCDSHCDSKCSTQTIIADVRDKYEPIVHSTFPAENAILPWQNHEIVFNYTDDAIWIDVTSDTLEIHNWNWTAWSSDLALSYVDFASKTVDTETASYQLNWLQSGKYKSIFTIADINGNTEIYEVIFYIDAPSFNVSTDIINIWNTNHLSPSFSPEVTITVKTVWAGFKVIMNREQDLGNSWEVITSWDGTKWYWFDSEVYSNTVSTIWVDQNIATQSSNINTDWELNTYTYKIKLASLVDEFMMAWEYEWELSFRIEYDY